MKNKNRKRYWNREAKDGTYIRVYRWLKNTPARNPEDTIEIEVKSTYDNTRYFIRPDEAVDFIGGLFLALLDLVDTFEDGEKSK